MSLESARLQRHKLISTNSSSKQSTLSESKNKEEHPLYLLTTQDDTGKDTSLERSKVFQKTKNRF